VRTASASGTSVARPATASDYGLVVGDLPDASTSWQHFELGRVEGDVQPLEFRIATSAREPPIDPPRSERTWLGTGRDPQQVLTRHVSESLGPTALERVGLVIYRATEPEARRAEIALRALLDPLFAEPVETYVEQWNEDLGLWQQPDQTGGDRATLAALGCEVLIRFRDQKTARETAAQIRDGGEVMVGWSLRHVFVALPDESSARTLMIRYPDLARADVRVRRLTRLRRRRLFQELYDRRLRPSGGWLRYYEPSSG
jgi:hypothetical protein